ncbi:N-terminal glutamine amidase-domain-containing protein [Tribonema minus]|uniref:Protein N-terminal glutamine amidohydrolase n=1 Tax=Tribonema minus TaxID=303371 RepID=A0A835YJ90_9STRA|nr:N-terminal glutamine amidase-domain-containing protein [Tribonema minus]
MPVESTQTLRRGQVAVTPYYCEENIYLLCQQLDPALTAHAVFISNAQKEVPYWCQRVATGPEGIIFWDYHVVLLVKDPDSGATWVYDYDTKLPWPCPARQYFEMSCRPHMDLGPYQHSFRAIPHQDFLDHFSSDRSDMKRPDGTWQSPPPLHPLLRGPKAAHAHTLPEFIDMTGGIGTVLTLHELMEMFCNYVTP